jgi:hypothetical protein
MIKTKGKQLAYLREIYKAMAYDGSDDSIFRPHTPLDSKQKYHIMRNLIIAERNSEHCIKKTLDKMSKWNLKRRALTVKLKTLI